jgi:ribosomal-protein-alanine acetyltransferase
MSAEPGTAIEIRLMSATDIDQVMAIATSQIDAPHWPRSAYVAALDPSSSPRRICLVALTGSADGIAGFAVANLLPPQSELESVVVAKDKQRQGIGSQLLKALVGELKTFAVREFLLEVRASNQPAIALYQSLGWRQSGMRPRYYAEPEEDAILMSRLLDSSV